jgi:hypothetical protein
MVRLVVFEPGDLSERIRLSAETAHTSSGRRIPVAIAANTSSRLASGGQRRRAAH